MNNKKIKFAYKTLLIALILFLLKHVIQAFIELTQILPIRPRAYIWGEFNRANYVIVWQFFFTFWVYILFVLLFFLFLRTAYFNKIKTYKLVVGLCVLTSFFILYVHNGEFPYRRVLSKSNPLIFNYTYVEEVIIYSFVGYFLIILVRKWLLKSDVTNK